jgi:hypothetical protein
MRERGGVRIDLDATADIGPSMRPFEDFIKSQKRAPFQGGKIAAAAQRPQPTTHNHWQRVAHQAMDLVA